MAKPKLKIMKTIDDIEELVNSSKAGIIHPELIKVDRDELMDLVQDHLLVQQLVFDLVEVMLQS